MLPRPRPGALVPVPVSVLALALALSVLLIGGAAARGGSRFFTFSGAAPGDQLGEAVAAVPDIDHDGFDDLVIGAWQTETGGPGYAQVRSGRTGAILYQWSGVAAGDLFGKSVAAAGDVDQDGTPDVLVGAPFRDATSFHSGAVEVYSGQLGTDLYLFGGDDESDKFGWSVAGAGDVNGDGFPDLIVGIPGAHGNTGLVRVFSGKDGTVLFELAGDLPDDIFGHSVSSAGELSGDGIPDLIVGAPLSGDANAGRARVFSGKDGALIHDLAGASPNDNLGSSVAGAGDVDGDGAADFVVGVPLRDSIAVDAGTVTIFSGKTGAALLSFHGDRSGSRLGESVAAAGDLDHDGFADVIAGAPLDDGAAVNAGFVRVYSGKDYPSLWTNYGPGWPGSLGIPTFTASANPAICTSITLDVSNSLGSYTPAAIMIGLTATYTPTIFDGILLVSPDWILTLQLPGNGFPFLVAMPCDVSLCGLALFLQVLEVDAGASKGVSFTQGLQLILGTQAEG